MSEHAAARRARRLARLYPPRWRARYEAEFVQLLIDDITERPHSLSRTVDVIRSGLHARLTDRGLAGASAAPQLMVRAHLCVLGLAVSAFLAAGVAVWAQLTIGWQWSSPAAPATRTGMLTMSAMMLGFGILALLAAIPVAWAAARHLVLARDAALRRPLLAFGLGSLVLIAGSIHFGHGWPGTGGHPWPGRALVPDAIARFCWAGTLWITSYWAHPGALASFPASELAWMVISPIALVVMLLAGRELVRRLPLSSRLLRYQSWLGLGAGVLMAVFLAGAGSWIVSGGPAPRGLFRVGAIDLTAVVVMAVALIVAVGAARRALAVRPGGPATWAGPAGD